MRMRLHVTAALALVSCTVLIGGAGPAGASDRHGGTAGSPDRVVRWSLDDVDAISSNDVWAVGGHDDAAVIKHWDGSRWHAVAAPAGTGVLFGVDHVSSTDAWAVGKGVILHWDGSSWETSWNAISFAYLYSVAAVSADDAWAVRYDTNSGSVVMHWDGTSWTEVGAPVATDRLYAVSADGPDDAWAVGDSGQASVLEHWDGSTWERLAPREGFFPRGVVALSPNNAWFVGSDPSGAKVLHWNGKHLSSVAAPAPRYRSSLLDVSAASPTDIWAVGQSNNQREQLRSLIEHWDGTSWTVVRSPGDRSHKARFSGVSALTSDDAWTVGQHYEHNRSSFSMTAHWDGSGWTRIS